MLQSADVCNVLAVIPLDKRSAGLKQAGGSHSWTQRESVSFSAVPNTVQFGCQAKGNVVFLCGDEDVMISTVTQLVATTKAICYRHGIIFKWPWYNSTYRFNLIIFHEFVISSQSDVFDILTSLITSKASGIDNISPKIFKYYAAPLLQVNYLSLVLHKFAKKLHSARMPYSLCDPYL